MLLFFGSFVVYEFLLNNIEVNSVIVLCVEMKIVDKFSYIIGLLLFIWVNGSKEVVFVLERVLIFN